MLDARGGFGDETLIVTLDARPCAILSVHGLSEPDRLAAALDAEVAAYGSVRRPWAFLSRMRPFEIAWRLGAGETDRFFVPLRVFVVRSKAANA